MAEKNIIRRYAYRSDSKGSVIVVVAKEYVEKARYDYLVALVDLWKVGLKSCFGELKVRRVKYNTVISKLEEMYSMPFVPISPKEARWLLKESIRIREFLHLSISRKCKKLLPLVGDLNSVEITGSIYKCFSCEKRNLTPELDQIIKKVALEDLRNGTLGTHSEQQIYFLCEKCKKHNR